MVVLSRAPVPVQLQLDRMSFFDGVLHVAGHVFARDRQVIALHVSLGDGWLLPFRHFDIPSAELAARFGSDAAAAGFDDVFTVPGIGEALRAELVISWDNGTVEAYPLATGGSSDDAIALFERFLSEIRGRPPGNLLEIGSRNRTGANQRALLPAAWSYTGFDILPGENVDIVGDAHRASTFLPHGHFDAVMSSAVFEHLLMPWKAVVEMNRVLRTGAVGIIMAPQCWPLHEEPSDYFRFSRHAWKALLNRATGFEIIAAAHGGTAFVVPKTLSAASAFGEWHTAALMSAVLFRKIGETQLDWPVEMDDIADDRYPL